MESLPTGAIPFLMDWAAMRGRVFTSSQGLKKINLPEVDRGLIEDWEGPGQRRLPLRLLSEPPDPLLAPKDLTRMGDFPVILLLAFLLFYFGVVLFFRGPKSLSVLALGSGLAAFIQMIPGLGWPIHNYEWRNV